MPVSTKTKAVAGLAVLDIARQVATAWSAKQQAERQRIGFGHGLREDARQVLRETRDNFPTLPSRDQLQWGFPPIRRRPTVTDRLRTWGPIGIVVLAATAAVFAAARLISRREAERDPEDVASTAPVAGAVRAGSQAIDAGMAKVVSGGSGAATGTASAIAAGSSAVRTATVDRAKVELDQRVVAPAKKKAVFYGTVGAVALTIYVVLIAVIVQLVVGAVS
ncbi:MAG: hypothetical protein JWL76_20 [Thermoleophilia bacterium]|nr:hypothetical protein [Thermoleophilia bacterium]